MNIARTIGISIFIFGLFSLTYNFAIPFIQYIGCSHALYRFHAKLRKVDFDVNWLIVSTSWSSGKTFVSEAKGMRFKFRVGLIEHSVANGSPPLQHFFERSCIARAQ